MSPSLPRLISLVMALFLVAAQPALADELDAAQQQTLQAIASAVKKAQANLKLALESAGPADRKPSGSKAKLALMRAGSARGEAQAAGKALADLPAGNAAVAAVQQQIAAIETAVAELEARITGAPAGNGPADAAGTKLDYRQEKKLKDAQFYLREVQGWATSLQQLAQQTQTVQDPDTIDHRIVANSMDTLDKARERMAYITGYLQELPEDGAGVKAAGNALAEATAAIDGAELTLRPLHERLQQIIDPASYPQLAADLERLRELSMMFGDPSLLTTDPERAAAVVPQGAAAEQEMVRVVQKYSKLMQQQTDLGKRVTGVCANFQRSYAAFGAMVEEQKQQLPERIQADLDEANDIAEEAVRDQKPLYFGADSGIEQHLHWAETKLALFAVLDPQGAEAAAASLASARARMKERENSLSELIITANELPPDRYEGADRQVVVDAAIAAWKELQPAAEVLAVRIPSQNWKRQNLWRLQNTTWYRIDYSSLQAQLLVKQDDRLAVVRAVNVWIDHMQNDELKADPMDAVDDELRPQQLVLLDKISS